MPPAAKDDDKKALQAKLNYLEAKLQALTSKVEQLDKKAQ